MAGRKRAGGRSWFVAGATVLVLAFGAVTVLAIVDAVRSDDQNPEGTAIVRAEAAEVSDADAAAARAREFYQRLVERQFAEAADLATGDARARVEELAARIRSEAEPDPELARIVDESTRGVLDSFDIVDPPRATGPDLLELDARAVVRMAEQPRTVDIWFALRKHLGGWRVERYRPSPGDRSD